MFNNDLLSDVSLDVRVSSDGSDAKKARWRFQRTSLCCRFLVRCFSPCSAGKWPRSRTQLPDCKYEGVLEMLRYLYSEEVKFNESNVMQVLYVAKKYILPSLAYECFDFLQRNVDPANVFSILSHAQQYDEKSLVDRCLEVTDRKTGEAVKNQWSF